MTALTCDLCVIGGGAAGLSVAAGASQIGARVVLIERGAMGGECLNTGCIPSKALIAAAQAAHAARASGRLGVGCGPPHISFPAIHDHIHGVIAAIAPHDSVERFEGLGVTVLRDHAVFASRDEVSAGAARIRARRFVIATGSSPAMPPIPGLAEAAPLTNESIFALQELPDHLLIVGGGPAGLEMAQSFRRLGARVTVIERYGILADDEPEAAAIARQTLAREGVEIIERASVTAVRRTASATEVSMEVENQDRTVAGSHLLVAAGRVPNLDGLRLDAAGVTATSRGIEVDSRLRTSNRKIFAIGDAIDGPRFTHSAGYQAGIVIRNALFGLPARVGYSALPAVTYLDPEVARAGLTEAEARKAGGTVTVIHQPLSCNDRAQTERSAEGFVKVVAGPRRRILGATIVAPHAGELIGLWGLAISQRLPISAVAQMILPYPTLSELSKRAAGAYYAPKLFGERSRSIVRFIQKWLP